MKKPGNRKLHAEYTIGSLDESDCPGNPFELLERWIGEAVSKTHSEPAMVLSTVDSANKPSSRVVLLKGLDNRGIHFFTNYTSRKAIDIEKNPSVAANFFWPELERQIRVEGEVSRLSQDESDKYFDSRTNESRINAIISPQSQIIPDRKFLLEQQKEFIENLKQGSVELKRPLYWGGFLIKPSYFEFWQGRPGRLHDRLVYKMNSGKWLVSRLAP